MVRSAVSICRNPPSRIANRLGSAECCYRKSRLSYLKNLDIGYYFYSGSYADDIVKVLDPNEKTIVHIPSVNSRESTKDKIKEVEHIIEALGEWQGTDGATGFQLVKTPEGRVLRIADLVDDDPAKRDSRSDACPARNLSPT